MGEDRIPVIIGCGEIVDRPAELADAREPLTLMADAARRAEADSGGFMLDAVDSLDIVNLASWRYSDLAGSVAAVLGLSPARAVYNEVGGESPVRLLHEAALRIAEGTSRAALICGAEAQHSAAKARRQGLDLGWTPFAKDGPKVPAGRDIVHPLAAAIGIAQPTQVYPFYDAASAAHWGHTPAEALAESGAIWARYSRIAAANPASWQKRAFDPEEITIPGPDNRLIAWPYTKRMVANPMVNQGAAMIVSSLAAARDAGVPEDRMVHFLGGASASEPRDFMRRDQYHRSHAQDAVLASAQAFAPGGFDAIELYSCFPCVPKMARRTLGLGPDFEPTVTGGLSFFGAPLSNYMLHAACAMVRRLRRERGTGLLYGQGEFVTKHHALALSAKASEAALARDFSVQEAADSRRGPVPDIVAPEPGHATVESFTILYGREGEVLHGAVLLRTAAGARTIAAVPARDVRTIARLEDRERSPVGMAGVLTENGEAGVIWTMA
jgi:acetyl-CoA C-acetyltransferase